MTFLWGLTLQTNNWMLVLLVVFVSSVCILYSFYYLSSDFNLTYYNMLILGFALSILILLFSGNPLVTVLGWEFLGITSFFLILYYQSWESYNNSMVTLITMRLGDYFLFLYLSSIAGYSLLATDISMLNSVIAWALIITAFTKSAQFPFSGWLPKAMSAPTPTSALVHSSTLVVAGFVLLFSYGETVNNSILLSVIMYTGWLTMLMGSILAISEYSVNNLVAYSTLSQMGMGIMVFGLGNYLIGYLHLISHGLAKSLLFMEVGYLIHVHNNQQELRKWQNSQVNSFIQVQFILTLMSLCGLIYTSGMVSKESILSISLSYSFNFLMYLGLLLGIYLTFLYSIILWGSIFASSLDSLSLKSSSALMLLITLLPFLSVLFFMSWSTSSIFLVQHYSLHLEYNLPIIFVLLSFKLVSFFFVNSFYNASFIFYSFYLSNIYHYKWLRLILPVKLLDVVFYHFLLIISIITSVFGFRFNNLVKGGTLKGLIYFLIIALIFL